jgi:hypothetical protein
MEYFHKECRDLPTVIQRELPFPARLIHVLGFQPRTEAETGREQDQGYDLERPGVHQRPDRSQATFGCEGTG